MANPLHDNPRSPKDEDGSDYTDRYNTKLSDDDEAEYQKFAGEHKKKTGRDLSKDDYDYDTRGWWKSGGATADNGHGPDTYKKPNHPTFSDESVYHGKDGSEGGKWSKKDGRDKFTPGKSNRQHWKPDDLKRYFQEREPDVDLED